MKPDSLFKAGAIHENSSLGISCEMGVGLDWLRKSTGKVGIVK
jgi:hypothetical protein